MRKVKDLVTGVLIGSILTASLTVGAQTVITKINAEMRGDYNVTVDGNKLELNGQYPIVYKGVTYLPLRVLGNAVGKDATWDSATKTVALGQATPKEANLYNLKMVKSGHAAALTKQSDYTNGGNYALFHDKINSATQDYGDVFEINNKYSKVTGRISALKENITFYIYDGDTKAIIYKKTLKAGEDALFDADVVGVSKVRFGFQGEVLAKEGTGSFIDVIFE